MSRTIPAEQSSGSVLTRLFGWTDGSLMSLCLASLVVVVADGLVQVSFSAFSMTTAEAWRTVFDPAVIFDPQVWQVSLLGGGLPKLGRRTLIVWNIRLPWAFVAILVGMSLAISGAIFQTVIRNELASPLILGVSSGTGLLILLTLVTFLGLVAYLPLSAALGGMFTFVLVYLIAWENDASPAKLVLAGVIVGTVFQSLQTGLLFSVDDTNVVQSAIAWTTESLTGTNWKQVRVALPWSIIAISFVLGSSHQFNILLLGEQIAHLLGMPIERVRLALLSAAALAVVANIVVAGIVGFTGPVVPHLMRNVVGSDYKRLVVGCLFAGLVLMVATDMGVRFVLSPIQLPVGVVVGLVNGPYSLYLTRKRQSIGEVRCRTSDQRTPSR